MGKRGGRERVSEVFRADVIYCVACLGRSQVILSFTVTFCVACATIERESLGMKNLRESARMYRCSTLDARRAEQSVSIRF